METNSKETNCVETNSSGDELLKTSSKETNCLEMKSRGTMLSIVVPSSTCAGTTSTS